jgi:hypothetical protein
MKITSLKLDVKITSLKLDVKITSLKLDGSELFSLEVRDSEEHRSLLRRGENLYLFEANLKHSSRM